jgi:hypothetical protein
MTSLHVTFFVTVLLLAAAASLVESFTTPVSPLSRQGKAAAAVKRDNGPRLNDGSFSLNIYSSYGYGAGESERFLR